MAADVPGAKRKASEDRTGVGRGLFCAQPDGPQQTGAGVSLCGAAGTVAPAGTSGDDRAARVAVSQLGDEPPELQAVWDRDEHGLEGRPIAWQHERCGKSEEAHKVMKEDLAGGQLPSGDFGENAAWWW